MRRKRRRIQYYNAEPTRERLRDKPWLPFVLIAAAALIAALITGAILGNIAERSRRNGVNYGDLLAYGGVENAEKTYGDLFPIQSDLVVHTGMDGDGFAEAIADLPEGNAVGVWLYDGKGGVWFNTDLATDAAQGLTVRAPISAADLTAVAADAPRYLVGYFVTGAFREANQSQHILAVAREMALLDELAEAGFGEVVIVGLPDDAAFYDAVRRYVRQADEVLGNTVLGVSIPAEGEVSRLIAATEGFADSYFLDARTLSGESLGKAITENAYFLTYYNVRLMLSDADRDAALSVVEGFGIAASQRMPKRDP